MARKMLLCVAVAVFALSLATIAFAKSDGAYIKGTVSKIEGDKVTITLDSKDQTTLKEGDQVSVKSGKMTKGTKPKTGSGKPGAGGGSGTMGGSAPAGASGSPGESGTPPAK